MGAHPELSSKIPEQVFEGAWKAAKSRICFLKKEKHIMQSYQFELPTALELHEAFKRIRNYLAGRVIGITRDKSLLHEVVKCLFCKMSLENTATLEQGSEEQIAILYRNEFNEIKNKLPNIFPKDEELLLDPNSIVFIDQQLSLVDLNNSKKDPLGELYQAFIGSDLRMAEGQFFTPHKAITWLVEAIDPKPNERIIDPACGPGGFLSYSARYLLGKGVSGKKINDQLVGIEKDEYLSNLARAHIALTTLEQPNVFCADSIERKLQDESELEIDLDGQFDIVLANPPFGAKIRTGSDETRKKFELAHKWKLDKESNRYVSLGELKKNTPPQILFIELCIKLLKAGGRLGIVVPESMISNSSTSFVVQYIRDHLQINAVCGMPEALFKTSGKGGTHTKTCLLIATKMANSRSTKKPIFMAEAKWCGHDSRGNKIPHDDLPETLDNFKKGSRYKGSSHLGYLIKNSTINDNILAPRYYDPEPTKKLALLNTTHEIVSVDQLVKEGVLSFSTGDEVGKLAYGSGTIPFVRTSDISNWEIKLDPKHGVSEEIYQSYKDKQDVREGDILMVRDGTYLIGSCAYVSAYDEEIVYQSHIYKIRTEKPDVLSPFLLLALFSCEPVIEQIKSKRFTQDIIDTLGKRVYELQLPIPTNNKKRSAIERMVQQSIEDRIEARELARKAKLDLVAA